MRLSQFCKNKVRAQYSFMYQAQYIAKKYMHVKCQRHITSTIVTWQWLYDAGIILTWQRLYDAGIILT